MKTQFELDDIKALSSTVVEMIKPPTCVCIPEKNQKMALWEFMTWLSTWGSTNGKFRPADGAVCELEAGGRIVARGTIVRRRGAHFFRVRETAKEERS